MELDLTRFSPAERCTLQLRALYEQAGYRKFRCARFEEYSLYQQNQKFLSDAQVITFTDLDGKLRAIRPDVTLSIAKNAQPAPGECKRYYYTEQVCRPSRESHTFAEISQMGLECIGAVDADRQAEVVRLAVDSLASLGTRTFLEVSHMGYLTGLLDALGVDAAARPRLLELLRDKNAHELRQAALSAGLDEEGAAALCGLLSLHGPFDTALAQARTRCRCQAQSDALDELEALYKDLGADAATVRLDLSLAGDRPVLLGGGVGVPPMYNLAKKLIAMGKEVSVILGFNTASEIFYEQEFKALGCKTYVTTVDGSYGKKGFVTDALPENYTYFYTCGPEPMLKAVYRATTTSGQMSFEERMGCGFGACMGCSCKTLTGYKRICKDGPVMKKEEILWQA